MKPILTELGVDIGGVFVYEGEVWTRTDTYSAKSRNYGSCRFGYIGDRMGSDEEWQNVLDTAKVIDQKIVEDVILGI